MLFLLALLACTAEPVDTADTADTGETAEAFEPVDVPCDVDNLVPGWWGGVLEGVRAPPEGCDGGSDEPCALTDGRRIVAEVFATNTERWHQGYDWIRNDVDDEALTYVQVIPAGAGVSECRITLH